MTDNQIKLALRKPKSEISDYMRELALRSHKSVLNKYGKEFYRNIAKRRWELWRAKQVKEIDPCTE